jgi:hypothetical protein
MADGGAPRIAHMGGTVDRHPLASVGSLVPACGVFLPRRGADAGVFRHGEKPLDE